MDVRWVWFPETTYRALTIPPTVHPTRSCVCADRRIWSKRDFRRPVKDARTPTTNAKEAGMSEVDDFLAETLARQLRAALLS